MIQFMYILFDNYFLILKVFNKKFKKIGESHKLPSYPVTVNWQIANSHPIAGNPPFSQIQAFFRSSIFNVQFLNQCTEFLKDILYELLRLHIARFQFFQIQRTPSGIQRLPSKQLQTSIGKSRSAPQLYTSFMSQIAL